MQSVLRRAGRYLLVIALLGVSANVYAQNWYAGFSFGDFEDDILDDSDTGWKLFAGKNLNENLGFEFGYVDLGKVTERIGGLEISAEQSGFNGVVVGRLPLNNEASLFGKIGLFLWESDVTTNFIGSGSDDGTDLTYGVGAQYDFSPSSGLRIEWEHFEEDIGDLLSVGIVFSF